MTLERLAATIAARKGKDPETSWTARLLASGPEKCAEKFGEEAVEAIIEAVRGDRARLISEAADVIYHLLVMLAARDGFFCSTSFISWLLRGPSRSSRSSHAQCSS